MAPQPVVKTMDLCFSFNGQEVLKNINLEIMAGEMVGIIGPNGAGKTTLLRLLLGLLKPSSGHIELFGVRPHRLGKERDAVGYMPQRTNFDRNFPLSVLDVVKMGLVTSGALGRPFFRGHLEKVKLSLEKVGLYSLKDKHFGELSGGQQQRVFLARALCKEPALLILDEPNAGLDLPTQYHFFSLLQELQQAENLTVVMVSHDLAVIARYANKLACINKTMHVHGTPPEVLNSPLLEKAYRCEYEILFGRERS